MSLPTVTINFGDAPSTTESIALNELRESLSEAGISAEPETGATTTGVKDGGLTLGLTIAGLAVSAFGGFVSAISLWGSKRNYSITFKSGDTTFAANNLTAKETRAIAKALKDRAVAADIQVLISKK